MKSILVCGPKKSNLLKGSIDDFCSKCKAEVIRAPSSVKLMKDNPEIIIFCQDCALALMEKQGGAVIQPMNSQQLSEISQVIASDEMNDEKWHDAL